MAKVQTSNHKKRILTGDNTTGNLHLGHYVGSLENRVKLQNDYETYIILADMHALAYPKYISQPQVVGEHTLSVAIGNLAVGLDPTSVVFFNESSIPEIYELAIILSMLVSHSRNLRNPTIKEEIRDKGLGDSYSLGFINFPVLMATDILCLDADLVPIGEDQLPHLELTVELAQKFNKQFGETFVVPKPLLGRVARLVGIDGNAKMTKSLNNGIFLNESSATLKEKVLHMYTDPARTSANVPGKIEGNPVFSYHDAFNQNKAEVAELKQRYATGKVGDIEVKEKLYLALEQFLQPIREKHTYYEAHLDDVRDIIHAGNAVTRALVSQKLAQVKAKLKLI